MYCYFSKLHKQHNLDLHISFKWNRIVKGPWTKLMYEQGSQDLMLVGFKGECTGQIKMFLQLVILIWNSLMFWIGRSKQNLIEEFLKMLLLEIIPWSYLNVNVILYFFFICRLWGIDNQNMNNICRKILNPYRSVKYL